MFVEAVSKGKIYMEYNYIICLIFYFISGILFMACAAAVLYKLYTGRKKDISRKKVRNYMIIRAIK